MRVWGIKGAPPPPTTKLAIFYRAGWQSEFVVNATGYGTAEKFDLYERMMKFGLKRKGILDKFDVLEFQRYATFLSFFYSLPRRCTLINNTITTASASPNPTPPPN